MSGYCATGRKVAAIPPTITIRMATTIANTGRPRKNVTITDVRRACASKTVKRAPKLLPPSRGKVGMGGRCRQVSDRMQ
jgi:hypothetical protein